MKVSQLLPVRPEPNTQTMFSGRTPLSQSPASLLASSARNAAVSRSCLSSFRRVWSLPSPRYRNALALCASPRPVRFLKIDIRSSTLLSFMVSISKNSNLEQRLSHGQDIHNGVASKVKGTSRGWSTAYDEAREFTPVGARTNMKGVDISRVATYRPRSGNSCRKRDLVTGRGKGRNVKLQKSRQTR